MERQTATKNKQESINFSSLSRGILQRKCACGNQSTGGGECGECGKKNQLLQRRAANETEPTEVPPIVYEVLNSPGQPLDPETRAFMEPRFGHDFSQVRIHTDSKAAESAQTVKALAYTVKQDIVFGSNQYAPKTIQGRKLLAHELTHTTQQQNIGLQPKLEIAVRGSSLEHEADAVSARIEKEKVGFSTQTNKPWLQRLVALDEGEDTTNNELNEEAAEDDNIIENQLDIETPEDVEVEDGDSPRGEGIEAESNLPDEEILLSESIISSDKSEEATTIGLSEAEEMQGGVKKPFTTKGSGREKKVGDRAKQPSVEKKKETKKIGSIKTININLTKQRINLIWKDGDGKKIDSKISSGKGCPNTKHDPCPKGANKKDDRCTPTGTFPPGLKGDGDYKNDNGDKMSWYVELKEASNRGIGIHDSQTVDGTPRSHGCVRVTAKTAEIINKYTTKQTSIEVAGKAPTKPWSLPKDKMKGYQGCPEPPEPAKKVPAPAKKAPAPAKKAPAPKDAKKKKG